MLKYLIDVHESIRILPADYCLSCHPVGFMLISLFNIHIYTKTNVYLEMHTEYHNPLYPLCYLPLSPARHEAQHPCLLLKYANVAHPSVLFGFYLFRAMFPPLLRHCHSLLFPSTNLPLPPLPRQPPHLVRMQIVLVLIKRSLCISLKSSKGWLSGEVKVV